MAEMTIRRFGVLSVAKMYGLLMFIFGLIFGVIYGLFSHRLWRGNVGAWTGARCDRGRRQHGCDGNRDDDRHSDLLRRPGIRHGS